MILQFLDGSSMTFHPKPHHTIIRHLKEYIQQKRGIPIPHQILLHNNGEFKNIDPIPNDLDPLVESTIWIQYVDYQLIPNNETLIDAVHSWYGSSPHEKHTIFKRYGPIERWAFSPEINDLSTLFMVTDEYKPNIIEDLSNWDTKYIERLDHTFANNTTFNQPIGSWNTENVTSMNNTFFKCTSFNKDISHWNTKKVTIMISTFKDCIQFNQDISSWDVSNVICTQSMFDHCTSFQQDLSTWKLSSLRRATNMFKGVPNPSKSILNHIPTKCKIHNIFGSYSNPHRYSF